MSIESLAKRFNALPRAFNELAEEAVRLNSAEIGEVNKDQLLESQDRNKKPLTRFGSTTVYAPSRRKPPGAGKPYILKDTGDFHKNLSAVPLTKEFFINYTGADRRKQSDLEDAFGLDVYGIQDRNIGQVSQIILKDFRAELRNYLKI